MQIIKTITFLKLNLDLIINRSKAIKNTICFSFLLFFIFTLLPILIVNI